jgi:phage baseplate assembly protein gpV
MSIEALAATLRELIAHTIAVNDRVTHIESRMDRTLRFGTVTDVDGKNHLIRMQIGVGPDGKTPHKSAWSPYSQIAGARKQHSVPSQGQQMLLIAVDGDFEQAKAIPFTWSDQNPSPSQDPNKDVDQRGKSVWIQTDGNVQQQVEKSSWALTKGNVHHRVGDSRDGTDPLQQEQNPRQQSQNDTVHYTDIDLQKGITHSVKNGAHKITIDPSNGITEQTQASISRSAQQTITDTAQSILHDGPTNIAGTLNVSQLLTANGGLSAPGGLSTGALEVAPDGEGGLVQATMGFSAAGPISLQLENFANDAAAAAGGIAIGQLYRTGNAVMVRLA